MSNKKHNKKAHITRQPLDHTKIDKKAREAVKRALDGASDCSIVVVKHHISKPVANKKAKTRNTNCKIRQAPKEIIRRYPLNVVASPSDFAIEQCRDGVIITGLKSPISKRNITSLTIPEMIDGKAVIVIGENAFRGLRSLVSVELPPLIRRINANAFLGCKRLKQPELPKGLQFIDESAFKDCPLCKPTAMPPHESNSPKLKYKSQETPRKESKGSAILAAWINRLEEIRAKEIREIRALKDADEKARTLSCAEDFMYASLDNGEGIEITGIKCNERNVTSETLRHVIIPDVIDNSPVVRIGDGAFQYCRRLSSVQLPQTITAIGEKAFIGCSALTSIELPQGLQFIGKYAFRGCSALRSIEIPQSVTVIGDYAFVGCRTIGKIVINAPSVMNAIDIRNVFAGCPRVATFDSAVKLEGITRLQYQLDRNMNGVILIGINGNTRVTEHLDIPTTIGQVPIVRIGLNLFHFYGHLKTITLPDSITSIGQYAFYHCYSLQTITIPPKVTLIEEGTFDKCTSLASVKLPPAIRSIGKDAFRECRALKSINIPNSLRYIGDRAFLKCDLLGTLPINGKNIVLGKDIFKVAPKHDAVTVHILPINIAKEDNFNYEIEPFTQCVTITGLKQAVNGAIQVSIPRIVNGIPVTKIGQGAFRFLSQLVSIKLPDTIMDIGEDAFQYCGLRGDLRLPNSITAIGVNAFDGCDSLVSVNLPRSLRDVGSHAFRCMALERIYIPDDMGSVIFADDAFRGCGKVDISDMGAVWAIGYHGRF